MVNNTFLDLQKLNATQRISIEGNDSLSSVESTSSDSVQCSASGKGNNTKKFVFSYQLLIIIFFLSKNSKLDNKF